MSAYANVEEAVLALEKPLRYIAALLARDEVEALLDEALDDVYEEDAVS